MELSPAEQNFITEVKVYAEKLKKAYAKDSTVEGNPEDQLKRPVRELLESKYNGQVETRTESQVEGLGARPDIGVGVQNLLAGHIELKRPGLGANKNNFTGSNYQQWKKFKNLPNLIYTDGTEWILYRDGERVSKIVRFDGDIIKDGAEAVTQDNARELHNLITDFLNWNPIVPDEPKALAKTLAPLCRLLRDDVEQAVSKKDSDIRQLFEDWKRLFFPEAGEKKFADAYAQTLTYALLLARLSGADNLAPDEAADLLESGHGLLAQTLRLLGQEDARKEITTGVDLLKRVIRAINPAALEKDRDLWLYFYEDFLAAYDSKLRKDYGVYYTPTEVIGCQVRLGAEILESRFNKSLGYADEGVTYLDPAAGTAAYPLAAIQHGLEKVEGKYGSGMVPSKASEMAQNFHAFEYMVGPYAVGHLRISKALQDAGASIPEDGLKIFLTNTLDNPDADPPRFSFAEREIAEEYERAKKVKKDARILVCMGNPPYDRQQTEDGEEIQRKGGWVRFGEDPSNTTETVGILRDFTEEAPGVHVHNLYNDYVYFWRWALWKLFENEHSGGPGILSFITASSYLRGPGFTKMREQLRREFDDLWIIDLEGDSLGARKTENVFNIQIPVAIAIGVRTEEADTNSPANVSYTKITGSREEKLSELDSIVSFENLQWERCFEEWEKPLLPERQGAYFDWPLLTDIFPWQQSGVKAGRTWIIGSDSELLQRRWDSLIDADRASQEELFKNSPSGRKVNQRSNSLFEDQRLRAIIELDENEDIYTPIRYAYRSFDRQWIIPDARLIDRPARKLWNTLSDEQLFITSMLTGVLGVGPAATCTHIIPDLDYYRGSYGAKHIIPLFKDGSATLANVTQGLLDHLQEELNQEVAGEDLFAYSYGMLATPRYTEKYSEELSIPGPRLPITKDFDLFERIVENGKHLIWLHTYGNRFVPDDQEHGQVPSGSARCTSGISDDPDQYPNEYAYNDETEILTIGNGMIEGVAPEVWDFSVSGLEIVKSWLDYRMKDGAGRTSSPLDGIRPERWTSQMTRELLELLWVLEHTISQYPEMEVDLEEVVQSECFEADELPTPRESERLPPADTGDQTSMDL